MAQMDLLTPEQDTDLPSPRRRGLGFGSLLALVAVVVMAVVVGMALLRQNQSQPLNGPAPDFTLTTFDSGDLRLSELRGKVVVVNFWASWCVPCQVEAPDLEGVYQQYKDRDVVFLGVAYTDTERNAKAFLAEHGITYPNGLDLGTRISDLYHTTGVPETFVVDQNGQIAAFYFSRVSETELGAVLNRLLNA